MKTKIIFAGLLGLAVMLPLALPAMALASPQDDLKKGIAADKAKDYPEAARWFRKAAEQGDVDAQLLLGIMYDVGRGVAQDDREAVRWYLKAAEQGDAGAQYFLGAMYKEGRGVKQDDREAVRWVRKAAEQGDAEAQYFLGVMYKEGRGVAQDYVQAHKWLNIASARGHKDAKTRRQEVEKKMSAQQIAEAQRGATKWLEEAYKKNG